MDTLIVAVRDRDEEAAVWPMATSQERINSTAVMLLIDNVADHNDIYVIHFTADDKDGTITFRTTERPDILRSLRQTLSEIPELDLVHSTV